MNRRELSDQQLIKEFVSGDQQSIDTLIKRHRERVYKYIVLIVKDQALAEDIFQDTFIKVIRSLRKGKYKDNGRFIYWALRIAHNLIIDHFRKEKNKNTFSNDDNELDVFNSPRFSDQTVEDDMIDRQISKDLKDLVNQLPDDQKEIIILRHFVGMSFKEIAQQTDVSINTALGRMRYALINLRKLMEEKNVNLMR